MVDTCRRGSISARAEEPRVEGMIGPTDRVDLRACGGTRGPSLPHLPPQGRSPRVRRNRKDGTMTNTAKGSISARAEEPARWRRSLRRVRVDLRACGGTPPAARSVSHAAGRSPRVRRNHSLNHSSDRDRGSISARAEEPCAINRARSHSRVDLRACGGTSCVQYGTVLPSGRSPRVRRNHAKELPFVR